MNNDINNLPEDVVLSVRGVSKKFCRNLKRSMLYGMRDLGRSMLGIRPPTVVLTTQQLNNPITGDGLRKDEFWALQDINFELKRGETLGLIGSNGSGKSTMLRLLTGIFPPDAGQIAVRGRVGALIALGAGFHPHMSGRENIYLNGAILGMHKEEIDAKFENIVSFSEIGAFLDAPVSTYSSGMHARLGFSIAIHVEPDLLLVDEVLSVGDMAFQAKCAKRMHGYVDSGGTVVFVSHNLNVVQSLCQRLIWLADGRCKQDGTAGRVIANYLDEIDHDRAALSLEEMQRHGKGTGEIRIQKLVTRDCDGFEKNELRSGESLTLDIHYETTKPVPAPYFWAAVSQNGYTLFGAYMLFDGFRPDVLDGFGIITCTFPKIPLMPGVYNILLGIRSHDGAVMHVESREYGVFRVVGGVAELDFKSPVAESMTRDCPPVLVAYEWRLPDGRIHKQSFAKLIQS